MISAVFSQSKYYRRNPSARSTEIGILFKYLAAILIFLTCFIGLTGNLPVFAESADALFIDQKGNVGVGKQTPRAKLDVNGVILGIGMVPPGGIVMFSGDINTAFDAAGTGRLGTPFQGWQLCNGNNGSPDLQDRFIAGAGRNYQIGNTGGADRITLTTDQLPAHSHTGQTAGSGAHQHLFEGTDAKGLAWRKRTIPGQTTVDMGYGGGSNADPNNMHWRGHVNTDTRGNHGHSFSTGPTGGGQAHENRPPFYALAFIMRLP